MLEKLIREKSEIGKELDRCAMEVFNWGRGVAVDMLLPVSGRILV